MDRDFGAGFQDQRPPTRSGGQRPRARAPPPPGAILPPTASPSSSRSASETRPRGGHLMPMGLPGEDAATFVAVPIDFTAPISLSCTGSPGLAPATPSSVHHTAPVAASPLAPRPLFRAGSSCNSGGKPPLSSTELPAFATGESPHGPLSCSPASCTAAAPMGTLEASSRSTARRLLPPLMRSALTTLDTCDSNSDASSSRGGSESRVGSGTGFHSGTATFLTAVATTTGPPAPKPRASSLPMASSFRCIASSEDGAAPDPDTTLHTVDPPPASGLHLPANSSPLLPPKPPSYTHTQPLLPAFRSSGTGMYSSYEATDHGMPTASSMPPALRMRR